MAFAYGASGHSQKPKHHIQTNGRSLYTHEVQFNDIRTILRALIAIYDNCNSPHTNAFDEAITTPNKASMRRATAVQLIAKSGLQPQDVGVVPGAAGGPLAMASAFGKLTGMGK